MNTDPPQGGLEGTESTVPASPRAAHLTSAGSRGAGLVAKLLCLASGSDWVVLGRGHEGDAQVVATYGLETPRTALDLLVSCSRLARAHEVIEVPDTSQHPVLREHPLVTHGALLGSLAAGSARAGGGHDWGIVLAGSRRPRVMSPAQLEAVRECCADVPNSAGTGSPSCIVADAGVLIEQLPVGLMRTDAQGRITYVNAAWRTLFGVDAAQALAGAWLDRVHPEDRPSVTADWSDVVMAALACEREFRVVRDGATRRVHCSLGPTFDKHGTCQGFVGLTMEVTSRPDAEDAPGGKGLRRLLGTSQDVSAFHAREGALRRTNDLLHGVLENLPCGLSVFDEGMRLVAFNQRFCSLLDLPPDLCKDEPRFSTLATFKAQRGDYGPGDPDVLASEVERSARDPRPHSLRRTSPSGRVLEILGAPLPGGGVVTTYVDVTEAHAADLALEVSVDRQKRALEASGLTLWDVDLRTGSVYLSDNWRRVSGGPPGTGLPTLEQLFAEVLPEQQPAVREAVQAVVKGNLSRYDVEHQVRRGDGELVWIHSRGEVTQRDADGRALRMSGTNVDISARRASERALREAKEAAEAANRAKSQFVATISHEIRTPLNGVLGLTRLLMNQSMDPRHLRLIELLDTSGKALMALVDDVLDFSKIEAGKIEVDRMDFDLRALLGELCQLYRLRAEAKGVQFSERVDRAVPDRVRGDGHRLRQVLNNLLSNALKFTDAGSIRVQVEAVEGAEGRPIVTFRIRDSGRGIPQAHQDRLFQRFVQVDSSATRQHGGSGLGLAIVKELCDLMGGTVTVQSLEGQGSTFMVVMAFDRAEFVDTIIESDMPPELPRTPRSGGILVVEDNPTNQVVVTGLLDHAGWRDVVLAHDGLEAMEQVGRRSFAVVLMDCHMPRLDGFEASRRIRAAGHTMPIIALTAGVTEAERRRCLDHGMNDILAKPVSPERLVRCLRQWTGELAPVPAQVRKPQLPGDGPQVFDDGAALDRLGGDVSLLRAAIDAFLADWPSQLERLRASVARRNSESARRELHSVAGAANAVGAVGAWRMAHDLQERCAWGEALLDIDMDRLAKEVALFRRLAQHRLGGIQEAGEQVKR